MVLFNAIVDGVLFIGIALRLLLIRNVIGDSSFIPTDQSYKDLMRNCPR